MTYLFSSVLFLVSLAAQDVSAAINHGQVIAFEKPVKLERLQTRSIDRALQKAKHSGPTATVMLRCHRYGELSDGAKSKDLTCYAIAALPDAEAPTTKK